MPRVGRSIVPVGEHTDPFMSTRPRLCWLLSVVPSLYASLLIFLASHSHDSRPYMLKLHPYIYGMLPFSPVSLSTQNCLSRITEGPPIVIRSKSSHAYCHAYRLFFIFPFSFTFVNHLPRSLTSMYCALTLKSFFSRVRLSGEELFLSNPTPSSSSWYNNVFQPLS